MRTIFGDKREKEKEKTKREGQRKGAQSECANEEEEMKRSGRPNQIGNQLGSQQFSELQVKPTRRQSSCIANELRAIPFAFAAIPIAAQCDYFSPLHDHFEQQTVLAAAEREAVACKRQEQEAAVRRLREEQEAAGRRAQEERAQNRIREAAKTPLPSIPSFKDASTRTMRDKALAVHARLVLESCGDGQGRRGCHALAAAAAEGIRSQKNGDEVSCSVCDVVTSHFQIESLSLSLSLSLSRCVRHVRTHPAHLTH